MGNNSFRTSIAALVVASLLGFGCNNSCVELADKVCERAGDDLAACEAIPASNAAPAEAARSCDRMQAVAASCRTLQEKAPNADDEDLVACSADLELIRALERAQN